MEARGNDTEKKGSTSTVLKTITVKKSDLPLNAHIPQVEGWLIDRNFNRLLDKCALKAKDTGVCQTTLLGTRIIYLRKASFLWQLSFNIGNMQQSEATGLQKKFLGPKAVPSLETGSKEHIVARSHVTRRTWNPVPKLAVPLNTMLQPYFIELKKAARGNQKIDLSKLAARIALTVIGQQAGIENFPETYKLQIAKIAHDIITRATLIENIILVGMEDGISGFIKKLSTSKSFSSFVDNHFPSFTRDLDAIMKEGDAIIRKLIDLNEESILANSRDKDPLPHTYSDLGKTKMVHEIKEFLVDGFETTTKFALFGLVNMADPKNQGFLEEIRTKFRSVNKSPEELNDEDYENFKELIAFGLECLRLRTPFSHSRWKVKKEVAFAQNLSLPKDKQEFSQKDLSEKKAEFQKKLAECDRSLDIIAPENTVIVTSPYYANRDPDVYGKDANEFNPRRWLSGDLKDFNLNTKTLLNNFFFHTFGTDDRMCPGRLLSIKEFLVFFAHAIFHYNVNTPKLDESQLEIGFPLELAAGVKVMGTFSQVEVKPEAEKDSRPEFSIGR